jgi:transcriptional regulator with XRE-family HTH domain
MMNTASRPNLGRRLRELRSRNNWRIADVSRMTGLASSTISKVENGRMSLTYDKLQQLAYGLSLDLVDLFGERGPSERLDMAMARRSVGRSGDGVSVNAGSYEYRYLNADLAPKRMVPIIGVVSARSLEEFGDLIKHEGEEFVLVLEGSIVVHLEFYAPLVLQAGDLIYIDSSMGHAYLAGSEGLCRMITVCTGAPTEEIQRAVQQRPAQIAKPARERPAQSAKPVRDRAKGNASGNPGAPRRRPAKTRK